MSAALPFSGSPSPRRGAAEEPHTRIFVASETTPSVWVFEATASTPVAKIPLGRHPRTLELPPDGRGVTTAVRASNEVSCIDVAELVESARVRVGRALYDVVFSQDRRRLYVSQEVAPFVSIIHVASRRRLPPLHVGLPQHDLAITPDGREAWVTPRGSGHPG